MAGFARLLDRFLLPKTASNAEEIRNVKLSDSLRGNIFVFRLLGYWHPEKKSGWSCLYWIYSAFMIFWVLVMWNFTQFVQFYLILDDLEQVAATSYMISCTGLEIIKAYYLLMNRGLMGKLVKALDREVFKPKDEKSYALVAGVLRFYQMIYLFFLFSATMTCFFLATYPIFDKGEKILPFNAWFPWDWSKTPAYELCYAYQVLGVFVLSTLDIAMDTTAAGLMSNICAQLDLLAHKLTHLYEETEFKVKKSSGLEVVTPWKFYQAMQKSLEGCIYHHRNIIELADGVGRVYNGSVFFQFIVTGTTLCMTMFQLTLVSAFSFEFFSLIFYQINISIQVVMYCWFGNEVILRSKKLMLAAFSTGWEDCSEKFKKNLLFFMMRLSKPMRLRAGGFFILSIDTFTLILRSSWSYFAVLKRVHGR